MRAAHAITIGSMVAVSVLQFSKRTLTTKDKWLLRFIGLYFLLGYLWAMPLRLFALAIASLQGNVATADGFLVVLSEPTPNPRPGTRHIVAASVAPVVLLIVLLVVIWFGYPWLRGHVALILGFMGLTFSAFIVNALLRSRGDGRKGLEGMVRVEGFVPISNQARKTGVHMARKWLKRQTFPVGWVADAGLLGFYDKVLNGSGSSVEKVSDGWPGFWGYLKPARYRFKTP